MIKSGTRKTIDKYWEQRIDQICDDMVAFARTSGTVIHCGACNNKGCDVCN